jgi:hypothetical protein
MIKHFTLSFIVTFLVACTNTKPAHSLKIDIDAVIQKPDSIAIYYTSTKSVEFYGEASYWLKVNGSRKNQRISFVFPDSIQPKQIRLDFGRSITQKEVVLNKIDFAYQNKKFSLKGKEIFYMFRIDENNTILDKLNGSIKRNTKDQINGPSLYPKGDKLFNKLNQLYSEK